MTNRKPKLVGLPARHVACSLGLLSVLGCAAPRVQVTGPLLNVPSSHAHSSAVKPTTRLVTRASLSTRLPPQVDAPPDDPPRRSPRRSVEAEQAVARFVGRPKLLFEPPTPIRTWKYIVLHHSASGSGSLTSIDQYHREVRGWDECGYHFVIGNGTESGDGEIEVSGRWLKQKHGAHTKHPDHPEFNDDGIGICLVGNLDENSPTPKQVEASRRLVAYLSARCGVGPMGVTTHSALVGQHTECPGRYFPYDRLIPRSRLAWLEGGD